MGQRWVHDAKWSNGWHNCFWFHKVAASLTENLESQSVSSWRKLHVERQIACKFQFSRLLRLLQHHEWCQSGGGLGGSSYFHRDPRNLHPRSRWDAGFNWSIFPSGGCDGGMGPWLHWSLLAGEESSKPLLARPYVGMLRPCQPCVGIVRKQQPWENYTKIVKVWVVSQIIICVGCTYSSVDCFRPVPTCNMKSPLFLLESSHIELSKSWSGAALSWLICWLQL